MPLPDTTPLLEIRGLSVTIPTPEGDVHAVRAVDLEIGRGDSHGLIGESGSGKTMTGMAMLGLVPKGSRIGAARFHFDGQDLRQQASRLRGRRIGMISQDPAAALNPVLSIRRQIDDVLRTHRDLPRVARRAEALALLAATGAPARFAAAEGFAQVSDIVMGRCSMCHAAEPGWQGLAWPPKGVVLDSPEAVAKHAREIWMQAGVTHAMPPANLSYMEEQERAAIRRWFRAATEG